METYPGVDRTGGGCILACLDSCPGIGIDLAIASSVPSDGPDFANAFYMPPLNAMSDNAIICQMT